MINSSSISSIGVSLLHEDFDSFYSFFRSVWEKPHTYVVLIARRCFNLNEIFMQVYSSQCGRPVNVEKLISNNALLLYSDEIAAYYDAWGGFPSILLVDDVTYHGRGIVRLLYSLEELIISSLEERRQKDLDDDERYYIHRDLAAAVDIYVFGVNRQPLLIDDTYMQNFEAETLRYTSELRSLSQNISSFIQQVGIPNTSYVLSCTLSVMPKFGPGGWQQLEWKYRGSRQMIFLRSKGGSQGVRSVLPTVRARVLPPSEAAAMSASVELTGLAIFDEISKDDIDLICKNILAQLTKSDFDFPTIFRILRLERPMHQKSRAQFLSFFLSIMCLRFFFRDLGKAFGDNFLFRLQTDIEKIARNFAYTQDILSELTALFERPMLWNALESCLYDAFSGSARPFFDSDLRCETPEVDGVNQTVSGMFYEIGMDSEKSAWLKVEGRKRFHPEKPGKDLIPLRQYIEDMNVRRMEGSRITEEAGSACMLCLMDNGLMSMNVEVPAETEEEKVQCVLKAGELATFVLPRYYHLFIPALALVERDCQRLNVDRRTAVVDFIGSLPENPPDVSATVGVNTDLMRQEEEALKRLKIFGADFVDRLYECGQSLNGWDIDLVTADDWRDSSEKRSYYAFVVHNMSRQQAYTRLAVLFLNSTDAL